MPFKIKDSDSENAYAQRRAEVLRRFYARRAARKAAVLEKNKAALQEETEETLRQFYALRRLKRLCWLAAAFIFLIIISAVYWNIISDPARLCLQWAAQQGKVRYADTAEISSSRVGGGKVYVIYTATDRQGYPLPGRIECFLSQL